MTQHGKTGLNSEGLSLLKNVLFRIELFLKCMIYFLSSGLYGPEAA